MQSLLLASTNPGKLSEMRSLLSGTGIPMLTLPQLDLDLEVVESGHTYAENAAIKALAYSRSAGMVALADDSGLEVDVLGGLPGIRSARFAPQPGASDADRRRYLLEQLDGHPRPWSAHFHCTVALAAPDGSVRYTYGNCYGEVIPEERGSHGFGYDPIFWIPEIHKTMAELEMAVKNQISHRARAILAAVPVLTEMLSGGA